MRTLITGKRLAWLLAYLYFTSYVTRINFAAVIQEVILDTGYEKSALSTILVCISVSYGLGQIINGRIGDRIMPQNLILIGLCAATAINLLFPLCAFSIPLMCLLWTINGFAQAMMWPPMVKIMVNTMSELDYGSSVVIVSLGSSIGTVFVYLTSPLIIRFLGWKAVMLIAAGLGTASCLLWLAVKNRCYNGELIIQESNTSSVEISQHFKLPRKARFPFALIALGIVLQGMLRDGITSWMPTYLSENFGFDSDKSILLTISLALVSIASFTGVGVLYKKFFKNEVVCAAVLYTASVIFGVILLLLFDVGGAVPAVLMMALITGCMHGINLMLVSHVPKRFRKHGNISTISGLVNSFTYVGAAAATYGIAKISELCGWKITVAIWLAIMVLGTLSCLFSSKKWSDFIKD